MAGSYGHIVDEEGKLLSNKNVNGMLENGGDVYEAIEEMYGMIWWLADTLEKETGSALVLAPSFVRDAIENYKEGISLSPGRQRE